MKRGLNNRILESKLRATRWFDSDRSQLRQFVAALNGENTLLTDNDRAALLRFVNLWNRSGRNIWNPPFFSEVISSEAHGKRFSLSNLEKAWSWKLSPTTVPRRKRILDQKLRRGLVLAPTPEDIRELRNASGLTWLRHQNEGSRAGTDLAVVFAGILLTNPLRMKLSDEPCQRTACQRWFIKKRQRQKQCSKQCRDIVRAAERNKQEREDKHEEKLKLARRLVSEWEKESWREERFGDWKEFIVRKTNQELTKKFITRAVTKGELMEPQRRKK